MQTIYQIILKNGNSTFIVADSDMEITRIWCFVFAAGLPIHEIKPLGPVLAAMKDTFLIPAADFSEQVMKCR